MSYFAARTGRMQADVMKRMFICAMVILIWHAPLHAQEKKLIQLTGKVTDELRRPIPFAHILILNNYRGAITNNYGTFSLVVEEHDSVLISSVGYKRLYFVIPDTLRSSFLNMDVVLKIDTLVIAEAQIYPWKTYDDFRQAFLNLRLPTEDIERARRNIALIRTQIIMDHEPSARTNFRYVMEEQYKQTFIRGQYPTYQIFNPLAWARFFQALKRGDFRFDNRGD